MQREVGDALRVEWRAFMLRPEVRERPLDKFRRYVQSWARPAEAEPAAEFRLWETDAAAPSHSVPALVATKIAASFGDDAFHRFHLRLMREYFVANRTVSDVDVQLDVAVACGIGRDAFADRLDRDGDRAAAAVVADHRAALAEGIAAVPSVMVDHEHVLTGALPTDAYRRIVERRATE